jgi:hypothetical protein
VKTLSLKNILFSLFGVTAISVSLYFNNTPSSKTFSIKPGQTKIIDQNIGYGSIYYKIDIENHFEIDPNEYWILFAGLEFSLVQDNDTSFCHFSNYNENEPFSIEIPNNSKLLVSCKNLQGFSGYASCTISERNTAPQKNYSFVPNFIDTTRTFIQSGKEELIYENTSPTNILIHLLISNNFEENRTSNEFYPFDDFVSVYTKRSNNNNKELLKPYKNISYIEKGTKIVNYILTPGQALFISSRNENLKGNCYFKKIAMAF